jgi:heme oxygenase
MKPTKNLNNMTAVEFLAKQALNYLNDEQENDLIKVIQQALEMEKQQIINAVEWNYKSNMGEVYYNAVYKNKEK